MNKKFNNSNVSISITNGVQSTICDPIVGMTEEKPLIGFRVQTPSKSKKTRTKKAVPK